MESSIIPIKENGNCLFRAVSYYIYNKNDLEIRLKTVNKIVNQWSFYKDFAVNLTYRAVIGSDENLKKSSSFHGYKVTVVITYGQSRIYFLHCMVWFFLKRLH